MVSSMFQVRYAKGDAKTHRKEVWIGTVGVLLNVRRSVSSAKIVGLKVGFIVGAVPCVPPTPGLLVSVSYCGPLSEIPHEFEHVLNIQASCCVVSCLESKLDRDRARGARLQCVDVSSALSGDVLPAKLAFWSGHCCYRARLTVKKYSVV
jgi:hypothetical protein